MRIELYADAHSRTVNVWLGAALSHRRVAMERRQLVNIA